MTDKRHSFDLEALAMRQYGVLARAQLLSLGASRHEVNGLLERGRLRVVHRNVYAIGGAVVPIHGRWLAAVLACGDGAVLSHWSAAALWRMLDPRGGALHVTCVAQRKPRKGIVVHRTGTLQGDATKRDRVPVTTPLRTIVDLERDKAQPRTLERALENAEIRQLHLPLGALNRRAGPRLRSALSALDPGTTLSRNELEELFLAILDQAGLPRPLVNAQVLGRERDFVWPDHKVVVEIDSRRYHHTHAAFERDRRRDEELVLAGWRPLRFTGRRLVTDPRGVAATIQRVLGA